MLVDLAYLVFEIDVMLWHFWFRRKLEMFLHVQRRSDESSRFAHIYKCDKSA